MDELSFGKQGKVFAQKKRRHEVLPSRNLNHCLSFWGERVSYPGRRQTMIRPFYRLPVLAWLKKSNLKLTGPMRINERNIAMKPYVVVCCYFSYKWLVIYIFIITDCIREASQTRTVEWKCGGREIETEEGMKWNVYKDSDAEK